MTNIRLIAPFLCTLASAALWASPGDLTVRGSEVWRASDGPRVVRGALTVEEPATLTIESGTSVEVSGNILVSRGATLKIEPGVIVRFAPGAGNGLIVNGNLEAAGTASEPVYFTSALDDRSGSGAGGEHYPTSLPGSGAHPGDWDGIRIEAAAGSSSKIENAIVRYSRNGLVTAGSGAVESSGNVLRDNLSGNTPTVRSQTTATLTGSALRPRDGQTNLMPSFASAPEGWTLNRYAPAGFAPPSPTVYGRSSELQIQINQAQGYSNRPAAEQSQYYGFQGYSYPLSGSGTGDFISADIYIPSALGNSGAGNAASYMWAIGSNGDSQTDYAIIGFTNSVGHGEFTVWDDGTESWTDLSTPVIYNSWNTLSVVFTGTTFDYYVNGVKVYSMMNNYGSSMLGATIMDAVNFFDPTTAYTGLNYSIVWANSATASTTSLSSSPNPSTFGAPVTLTATVAPSNATGFATFVDGTTILGTGILSGGTATYQTSSLSVGSHSLTAIYGGDGNYSGSTSSVVNQTVKQVVTTTSLTTSVNPAAPGQSVTLTAMVSPSTATGTVTFYNGGTSLGTITLTSGTAQFTASFGYGTQPLKAVYSGDANDASSTSPVVNETIPYPPLSIRTASLPSGMANQAYGPVFLSAMGGSGSYSWTASGLPQGLTLSGSGALGGTPTAGFNGSVMVLVMDTISLQSASATYQLIIAAPPLSVSGPSSLGDVLVGGTVAGSYTAMGGLPPYTWSISGASGIAINSNGNVSGKAGSAGTFTLTIGVRDSLGTAASATATLSVLAVATSSLPSASIASPYSASVSVIGGVPPYTFTASGTPAGITFSSGVFGGQATTAGSYPVTVTVADSTGLSIAVNYSIAVSGSGALSVTSSSLPSGVVGQPYSAVLSASGGSPAYTWSQSGGLLPAGLSLSSSGTVSGVPTTPTTAPDSLGVQVTDTSGGQAVGTVTIGIAPAPIQITTAALPAGLVGVPYPAQILTASGGVPPYTFTIMGSLPAGLSLSGGQISGTPTTVGSSSFTIQGADSQSPASNATMSASVAVGPNITTVVLSAASASFSLVAGASSAPQPISVDVSSSNVGAVLNFTSTVSVPWLTVSGSSSTPGSIMIGLNSAALALSSTGSPYTGTVTLTCTGQGCAATATPQTVAVTLTVSSPPAQLSVDSMLLSFAAMASAPQSSTATFNVANLGSGSIGINSITGAASWLSISSFAATLGPSASSQITVTANPMGLQAGYYRSNVLVNTTAGSASIPVTFLISGAATMTLGPAGTQFAVPQGGTLGNAAGSFLVGVTSSTAVSYTTAVTSGASWLSVGAGGTATSASPGTVSYSLNRSAVTALAAGAYYGTIQVTASGVVNSPQAFQVVLNITPAASVIVPDAEPAGLVFITAATATPPAQLIQVYADSATAIPYQASASVSTTTNWLSINPATGMTQATAPGQIQVSVAPAGLSPGIYRGGVSVSFGSSSLRTVNVTLIVTAPVPLEVSGAGGIKPQNAKATCTNGQLVPTQTGLVSDFSSPASWPTPLAIVLADTCGNLIVDGQMVTTFSNGDPPLPLALVDSTQALYSGTWTPRNPGTQVTVSARASASGYPTANAQVTGKISPNTAPVLAPNATGDVFNPQVGGGLGPGNIVQIYGSGLASQAVTPAVLPLPSAVSGTMVLIGGIQAPLFYISPGQINAQIPFGLTPNQQYQVIVSANGALTTPQPIQINSGVPSVLAFTSGAVVAQHADNTLVSTSSPAVPGENLVIYLTGLGATTVNVPSGSPSPSSPLAYVTNTPALTLNGNSIPLLFAGLTPGLVGLYQINFQVPAMLAAGNYTLAISQNGTVSNSTLLPVQ